MFLGQDYLIGNETGKRIFASVKDLPILDPHNHADVAAIARNENFKDAWELFAATDHYVWEVLRKTGVPEEKITGKASPHDKFIAMAEVFDQIAGNPVYEWIHLDLRFLGVEELLSAETGEQIWKEVNDILAKEESRPQALLKRMNVEVMCSTDDPADTLEYHKIVNGSMGRTIVRPTWRPDAAMKAGKPGFPAYIERLGKRWGVRITTLAELLDVLQKSHDFFAENGCRASDHGLELASSGTGDAAAAAETFKKALAGESVSPEEASNYADYLLGEFGEMNSRSGWVMQLHMGAVRDVRDFLFRTIGPDSGGDVSDLFQSHEAKLIRFLNRFDGRLKVVLYCLDQVHQAT
ncbi:MAG: glucuronate isomerase, partial [Lentisphaeria bacterium]|nr:glucuronate isomerase [Lentisphaeria bacterium]